MPGLLCIVSSCLKKCLTDFKRQILVWISIIWRFYHLIWCCKTQQVTCCTVTCIPLVCRLQVSSVGINSALQCFRIPLCEFCLHFVIFFGEDMSSTSVRRSNTALLQGFLVGLKATKELWFWCQPHLFWASILPLAEQLLWFLLLLQYDFEICWQEVPWAGIMVKS